MGRVAHTTALIRKHGRPAPGPHGADREFTVSPGTAAACLESETLASVLDGGITPAARARVEEHASRCESCRQVLSALARSGTPAAVVDRVRARGDRALSPGTRLGRYILTGEIGSGGMGVVHAAHDPELDRAVAIKLLRGGDPELQMRLRREAQVMAQLAHPNVVTVHDVGVFEDELFIAMEYIEGETLASWIAKPRSVREVLEVFRAAGRGLAAAHAAGIVHRDFKPENVLIGTDGWVRVGDFGLARPGDVPAAQPVDVAAGSQPILPAPARPVDLTATGMLLGTPHYLAPEIYNGEGANARSDQFSFCVALYTALYDARPFDGDSLDALAASVRAGRVREPAEARRVPRRIRAALRRGLAVDPGARFGSMDELLAELVPARGRWPWAIGAGPALGVIAWMVARSPAELPDLRCTGAAAEFATTWNASRREAIRVAFATATRAPYAAAAFERVSSALDRYAARWADAHTEACRASRILGEQTDAMLELRMSCLEHRRDRVAALVTTLMTADADAVAHSIPAALALEDVAACAETGALRQVVPRPTDASRRTQLDELAGRLADAQANYEVGAYARALELVRPVVSAAHELAYRPFEAEAELARGEIELAAGDLANAETTLGSAVWAAEAGRDDAIAARAWIRLIWTVGHHEGDTARALAFVPRVTAVLERIGGDADIEARLEGALAVLYSTRSEYGPAIAHAEKAVAVSERAFGADDPQVSRALQTLAITLGNQGRPDRAAPILQRVYAIRERTLGPNHPDTAVLLSNLGSAHNDAGDPARAVQELRRALAILEASLDPYHLKIAYTLCNLAAALDDQGLSAEAELIDHRALAVGERAFDRGRFGVLLLDHVEHLGHLGRYREARAELERAERHIAAALGPGSLQMSFARVTRADLLFEQARWGEAAVLYENAIPLLEAAHVFRNDVTLAVLRLGLAGLELGQPRRGLPFLERVARRLDELRPDLRVEIGFALARALWDSGGDRRRAYALATRALADAARVTAPHRDPRQPIERWLAGRPAE
jgi:eukaryotic-like serine/threonine-protein kinase